MQPAEISKHIEKSNKKYSKSWSDSADKQMPFAIAADSFRFSCIAIAPLTWSPVCRNWHAGATWRQKRHWNLIRTALIQHILCHWVSLCPSISVRCCVLVLLASLSSNNPKTNTHCSIHLLLICWTMSRRPNKDYTTCLIWIHVIPAFSQPLHLRRKRYSTKTWTDKAPWLRVFSWEHRATCIHFKSPATQVACSISHSFLDDYECTF